MKSVEPWTPKEHPIRQRSRPTRKIQPAAGDAALQREQDPFFSIDPSRRGKVSRMPPEDEMNSEQNNRFQLAQRCDMGSHLHTRGPNSCREESRYHPVSLAAAGDRKKERRSHPTLTTTLSLTLFLVFHSLCLHLHLHLHRRRRRESRFPKRD